MPAQAIMPPRAACVVELIHVVVAAMAEAMLSLEVTLVGVKMYLSVEGRASDGGGLRSRMLT
jgi:hypothetical protein